MGVNQSLAEVARPLAAGGEMLRQRMLFLTRSLFGVAALALAAIAATVGALYFVHAQSASWVSQSREVSRLARLANVLTVQRELLRRANAAWPEDKSPEAGTARTIGTRFAATLDSLERMLRERPEGSTRITSIRKAHDEWAGMLEGSLTSSSARTRAIENERFETLLRQLGLLARAEEAEYSARLAHEKDLRRLTTLALLVELLLLMIVLNGIRTKLVSQATEVLRQKDAIERQALELEDKNAELASAIRETEMARVKAQEQAEEQKALMTAITEVFFVLDRDGRYHKVAPSNKALHSAEREAMLGRTVHETLPPDVAGIALSAISRALATRRRVEVEYALDIRGRTIWFTGTVTPLGEDRVLWVARDVSDSRISAEALKESEARFRNLVEHSPQAVALHAEGRMLYANPACAALLGAENQQSLLGERLLQFVTQETTPRLMDNLASLGRGPSRSVTCECQFRRAGLPRLIDVEVTSVPVVYNGRAGVLSILHDVTERKQLEGQLAHQAFHDPLTNLANRVLFRDRVEHALQRAVRGTTSPSVLFIDLDNFKAVNDGLGHSAGDWLLIEVAGRLTNCLRPADTVARLGGDEFAVLLDDETADATKVADRILTAFQAPFAVQGTDIVVTMSIGIAPLTPHQGADDVLRNADLALYRAKGEGKARAASFEPSMHVAALRRLELEGELRRAIEGDVLAGKLVLHYQPIARLSTGKLFGCEALVRWQHPERGIIEPLDFISLAEETGLIVPLGKWVLNEACRQTVEWHVRYGQLLKGTGMYLLVSVNLSGRHLSQPDIVNHVSCALDFSGLPSQCLMLEMTESMLVHDNLATLERLHSLKSLGVRLAIDDFGTGYSSLAYLERFPVDSLKMDRSFIAGLAGQGVKAPLAEAVIGLGRILGLRVVAEGIETQEQWDRLRLLGCGLGQGFYISRPLTPDAFEAYLRATAEETRGRVNGRFHVGRETGRRTPVSDVTAIA
ncbi:MAG TPA: EAL domain-containing protein [Gemmatimonadaceae bacterium]|nr:EAL domain-containing protein [Gemmatimonadaceae bacterium]